MVKLLAVAGLLSIVSLFLSSCTTAPTEHCHVDEYPGRQIFKAMAMSSDGQCYWVWNRSSQREADQDALSNCRVQRSGCSLVRSGNQYVGAYRRGQGGGATASDFFQGAAAGALIMGGNSAAGGALMSDLARRGSPQQPQSFPVSANLSGIEGKSCSAQERMIANETNRLSGAASRFGICQAAVESARLYRAAAKFHRVCYSSSASALAQAAEYDRAALQADATARASCSN